jgi:hypothetical protein
MIRFWDFTRTLCGRAGALGVRRRQACRLEDFYAGDESFARFVLGGGI